MYNGHFVGAIGEYHDADFLRECFQKMELPETLASQISLKENLIVDPEHSVCVLMPPRFPGASDPLDLSCTRPVYASLWGYFSLAEWVQEAPWCVGPEWTLEWANKADEAAQKLRAAGEGSKAMWALDLLFHDAWEVPIDGLKLTVSRLIQFGPSIGKEILEETNTKLGESWCQAGEEWDDETIKPLWNEPATHNGVKCVQTTWIYRG